MQRPWTLNAEMILNDHSFPHDFVLPWETTCEKLLDHYDEIYPNDEIQDIVIRNLDMETQDINSMLNCLMLRGYYKINSIEFSNWTGFSTRLDDAVFDQIERKSADL